MALLTFTKNKNMGQNGPANFYPKQEPQNAPPPPPLSISHV